MPGPTMLAPHQLAATSTLEYRPPPRRSYSAAAVPAHMTAGIPGMMDESGLGLFLMLHIRYQCLCYDNSVGNAFSALSVLLG